MTTDTTNSQAASFRAELLPILRNMYLHFEPDAIDDEICSVLDMIDAKLAQAREEGILFERKRLVQTIGNANDLSSECLKQRDEANARAIAAESRLAEIQRGIKALKTQRRRARVLGTNIMSEEYFFYVGDVLALLQPQGQADTSGLPG